MKTEDIKDTCLYIQTRKDDGGIFYLGIGDEKRPYCKKGRNKFWHNVVNKHDYDVTILKTGMTWKEACELEIKMIAFYGRIKPYKKNPNYGCLVNMTDGGQGAKGLIVSKETKKKQSEDKKACGAWVGEKNPMFGSNRQGEKNPFSNKTHNEESLQKMRKPRSEEVKKNMRKPKSEEGRKNIKESAYDRHGEKNPKATKVTCSVTGKIYGCIKEAAKDNGISYNTLLVYLRGTLPNKTSLRYL
jgi:hypothetical protein